MGPRPDAAGHGGHCLPVPAALRFPFLMPGGTPGLWFPLCSWRGLRGEREGSGWVPLRRAALLGVLLGIFYTDVKSLLLLSGFLRCHMPVSWISAVTEQPGHCSLTLVGGREGSQLAGDRCILGPHRLPPPPHPPPADFVASASLTTPALACHLSDADSRLPASQAGRKTW